MFLDQIFKEVKQLGKQIDDIPDKTPIEQRFGAMKLNQEKKKPNKKQNK